MPTAEEFDEFYVSSRRRLVIQAFALTGDLTASRNAVRDAFVAAQHHWDKVGRSEDPESWVRPRAWSAAQRRRAARPIHRERHLDSEQSQVLDALHKLPDQQRRTLILTHLSDLDLADIVREIGVPRPKVEELVDHATVKVATVLDCEAAAVGEKLALLESASADVKLPRASIIRRNGMRRRRNHSVVGSIVVAAALVVAGAFVAVGSPAAPSPKAPSAMKAKDGRTAPTLLQPEQITNLSPKNPWSAPTTTNNTQGTVVKTMCQTSLFADKRGQGTRVRKYVAGGTAPRSLIQTLEISTTPGNAKEAYDATLSWYAGCKVARIQLVDAYTVSSVGDQAQVLRMRIPGRRDRSFVIGIARTGSLTTSTVLETRSKAPAAAKLVAATLATSVRNLCTSQVAGACVGDIRTVKTLPPESGEATGMLAVADLPVIPGVRTAWSGTSPKDATKNPAATTCDRASFKNSGAPQPLTRSFVILKSGIPATFGVTETIGTFRTARRAAKFVDRVIARMEACPDQDLGSTVTQQLIRTKEGGGSFALWRLGNQVRPGQPEVMYWVGIARVGSKVSQVLLTPVKKYDVKQSTFALLLGRAQDRLNELK